MKSIAIWALKLAVSAGLMWLTFRLAGEVDLSRLRLLAPVWLAPALALMAAIVVLLALRWRIVARGLDALPASATPGTWMGLIWAGIAVSQVVPGGISGDAVRVWGMTRHGAPLGRTVEAVALDRAAGLAGLTILGCGAWAALGGGLTVALLAAAALTGAALLRAGWGFLPEGGIRDRLAVWGRLAASREGAAAVAMAAASHALNVGIFIAIARAFGLDPGLGESFLAVPAGLLASALPVSLGGWGVRELAIANGFALAGGDAAMAVQASILFGAFHLLANAPALLLLLLMRVRGRSGPALTRHDP